MTTTVPVSSKLPDIGVSIFAVQTKLANEHKAINLSQGFPDFDCDPALVEAFLRCLPDILAFRARWADAPEEPEVDQVR